MRAVGMALAALLCITGTLQAQDGQERTFPRPDTVPVAFPAEGLEADANATPLTFGPGERLVYNVKVGWFNVGEGELAVLGVDTIRGHRAYRLFMRVQGGKFGIGVNSGYNSWMDIETLQSWRYMRTELTGSYSGFRFYEMYPARQSWERQDNDEFGPLGSQVPVDDISFIYLLRDLPLIPGETHVIDRYFKEEGNPIEVRVVRYDTRKEDGPDGRAVEYNTVVLEPRVKSDGLFGDDGEAEIHVTRDPPHYPVYLKFDLPRVPGSLTLHLREVVSGLPLNPEAREEAQAQRSQEAGSGQR